MKKLPPIEVFDDIAIELGVDPSFIEKDWFAVKILQGVSTLSVAPLKIIFAGGTSLSKGYGLIKRFSEDLDFRIIGEADITRGNRKAVRKEIISTIDELTDISVISDSIISRNESRFFSFSVEYPQTYQLSSALRPHLKLEFSFENIFLPEQTKPIQSFVTQFTGGKSDCTVDCISPVETAGNKFSALLWRMTIRDRTAKPGTVSNDPAMIRHLHDLSALENLAVSDSLFIESIYLSIKKDLGRSGSIIDKSLKDMAKEALEQFEADPIYKSEYTRFVDAMSYAPDDESIGFETAVASFERIVGLLI
jgi:predicted nucleotidyltransferase component of viral defense system